jgi:hypothetical protein
MMALSENIFRPLYQWHQIGMTFKVDHGDGEM